MAPIDYNPVVLRKPFRPHLTVNALPSEALPLRPVRRYPHFWISTRGLGSSGTLTHLRRVLPGTHYGPLRLPAADDSQVMDSLKSLPKMGTAPGLPGSSTDLSARALPNHPGRLGRCSRSLLPCRWQASPNLGGWPPPDKCNEAESGSLALGLAPSLSRKDHFLSPLESQSRDRPAPRVRLPCT